MKKLITLGILFIIFFAQLSAQEVPSPNYFYSEVSGLMTQYNADRQTLLRLYIAENSPERAERFIKLNQDYLASLKTLKFNNLSRAGQVDYLLFKRDLNQEISDFQQMANDYNRLKKVLPFAETLYQIEREHRRGKVVDGEASASLFNQSSKQIKALMAGTDAKGLPMEDARFVQSALQGIKRITEKFYTFIMVMIPYLHGGSKNLMQLW